eukprot:TRINITY_DN4581_c0_g1_i1.p1 TRINITY_DN4581_c0_g1~~TRINITY_DN4581_c0_g1_i1.p1  ORF type:complete len:830 (-),score=239.83 TRINITY_DN4581_c0_g1_i1:3-2315(-)
MESSPLPVSLNQTPRNLESQTPRGQQTSLNQTQPSQTPRGNQIQPSQTPRGSQTSQNQTQQNTTDVQIKVSQPQEATRAPSNEKTPVSSQPESNEGKEPLSRTRTQFSPVTPTTRPERATTFMQGLPEMSPKQEEPKREGLFLQKSPLVKTSNVSADPLLGSSKSQRSISSAEIPPDPKTQSSFARSERGGPPARPNAPPPGNHKPSMINSSSNSTPIKADAEINKSTGRPATPEEGWKNISRPRIGTKATLEPEKEPLKKVEEEKKPIEDVGNEGKAKITPARPISHRRQTSTLGNEDSPPDHFGATPSRKANQTQFLASRNTEPTPPAPVSRSPSERPASIEKAIAEDPQRNLWKTVSSKSLKVIQDQADTSNSTTNAPTTAKNAPKTLTLTRVQTKPKVGPTYYPVRSTEELKKMWNKFYDMFKEYEEKKKPFEPTHLHFSGILICFSTPSSDNNNLYDEDFFDERTIFHAALFSFQKCWQIEQAETHMCETVRSIDDIYLIERHPGDETFVLCHEPGMKSIILRWRAATQDWKLLIASGDNMKSLSGVSRVLDTVFPYNDRDARVLEDAKKRVQDNSTLNLEQKARMSNLINSIVEVFDHYRIRLSKLPKTSSLEDLADLGNTSKSPLVENLISRLISAIVAVLEDGFDSWTLFGTHFPWDWIRNAATDKEGVYDTTAFSATELEMDTVIAEVDLNNTKYTTPQLKLKAFITSALVIRGLKVWIELLLKNTKQLERFYYTTSIFRLDSTNVLNALSAFDSLPLFIS